MNSLDSEKLEEITVDSNNICSTDLTPFARLVNLKELWLGNAYEKKINQGIYYSTQIEFNEKYPKEKENIRVASGGKFEGQLIIENYSLLISSLVFSKILFRRLLNLSLELLIKLIFLS
ncbi:MAG: hypothetical protein I3270_01665 [Candidatus Moeniiplasma glomeromycotorum]|nr:hypothetical protein [Candidatus Moeniiplasma glomeromycotorum]MCE8162414.1 hypothetical protein [Candidatus Moeniiplasma glomeromycotorum]MCE8166340.1 hypothetical protein [Candidatus Moeniiplasma glomeromycotorum]MCE8166822.1 hypothetical protein [Candidatus Moeniiplasma glomeromycotorum]